MRETDASQARPSLVGCIGDARPRKVLHCISALQGGGAERQLGLLLRNWKWKRIEMAVLCFEGAASPPMDDTITIIRVSRGPKWQVIGLARRVQEAIAAYAPDLIHTWLPEILTVPAAAAGFAAGIPILSSQRRAPARVAERALWLRDRCGYPAHLLASRMVANFPPSSARAPIYRWLFRRRDGVVIRNAVDVSAPLARRSLLARSTGPYRVVFAGRLVRQKRVGLLIEAMGALKAEGCDVRLAIYGDGPLRHKLRELAASIGVADRIAFHGFRPDWHDDAALADVFALPSVSEGMPNVLLEASAVGLPVLATRIPEIAAVFTHDADAWLVKPDDRDDLVKGLGLLVSNPAIGDRLVATASGLVRAFSIQAMVDSYVRLYGEMLGLEDA
jgi:glycosyltransferase involved in cell wall biosynthesis